MKPLRAYLLGNAVVWGTVILACALVLRGTPLLSPVLFILGGGAVMSVLVLGAALGRKS